MHFQSVGYPLIGYAMCAFLFLAKPVVKICGVVWPEGARWSITSGMGLITVGLRMQILSIQID